MKKNYFYEEAKKLSSQKFEEEKNNFDGEISFEDFAQSQMILLDDCRNSLEKEIIASIENSSLEELKELKEILKKVVRICDNYFYNNIAIDKAQ